MSIQFDFDETKAAQVAGIFVQRCGGLFDYYLLQKCIYALDRAALLRWGQPVLGGDYKMLPFGPVNQAAMDNFKNARPGFFAECFVRSGNEVRMKKDPGLSELSRAEIQLIESICDDWKGLSFEAAHAKIAAFPECADLKSVVWIEIERILSAAGKTTDEIESIAQDASVARLLRHPTA
jgi:hypothetical protein